MSPIWRNQGTYLKLYPEASFLVMACFLLRDYNIQPKKELHWSPWVMESLIKSSWALGRSACTVCETSSRSTVLSQPSAEMAWWWPGHAVRTGIRRGHVPRALGGSNKWIHLKALESTLHHGSIRVQNWGVPFFGTLPILWVGIPGRTLRLLLYRALVQILVVGLAICVSMTPVVLTKRYDRTPAPTG